MTMKTTHSIRFFPFCLCLLVGLVLWPLTQLDAQESTLFDLTVVGDFNGWNTESGNMVLIADHLWQADLSIPGASFEFKFTTPGWAQNYGVAGQPFTGIPQMGVGVLGSGNIQVNNPNPDLNTYRFTFNDQTGRFTVQLLGNLNSNLLRNASFETPGSNSSRARFWQNNVPNVHGGFQGSAVRAAWDDIDAPTGEAVGAILGTWAGSGSSGSIWQEVPIESRVTYEVSADFYAEGAPNEWTAAEQGMRLEFFDFSRQQVLAEEVVDLADVTSIWQRQAVNLRAPSGAHWARVTIYAQGVGAVGTFQFDDVVLEAVSASREQDFDDWFGADVDGSYLFGGWRMNRGRVVDTVDHDGFDTVLARSGLAASLAPPIEPTTPGGDVISAPVDGGIGVISLYYRHGYFGDPVETPDEPVNFRVQIREFEEDEWNTVATVEDAFNTEHFRLDAYVMDFAARYIRIQHMGGSTNRLIIDDVLIGLPEDAGEPRRVMNFDTWTGAESDGCYTFDSWTICTGRVVSALAKSGLSAHIIGADGDPNYLQSPAFVGGYGAIQFSYRRGDVGPNTVGFVIEASTDEVNWHTLDSVSGIFETSWQDYSRYFYNPVPHFIRIRNVKEMLDAETGAVLLFETFDAGRTAPPGWTFSQIGDYSSAASYNSPPYSIAFNQNGSQVITPTFANPTNVTFMMKGQGIAAINSFVVEALIGGVWQEVQNFSGISNAKTFPSFPIPSTTTRLRFTYNKPGNGNLAFDDLLITGDPPPPDSTPQSLLLDDVVISRPVEFRTQNFNAWPTKNSYAGDSSHQFWTITGDHIVNAINAFEGQVARLRRASGVPDPVIQSHFFFDGIGAIEFKYRAWPNDVGVGMQVQVSSNGVDWVTLDTITSVPNDDYVTYGRLITENPQNWHYLRIVQHAGAAGRRLMVDNISVARPLPQPSISLLGSIEPERPYSDDVVDVLGFVVPRNGATDIELTAYYREGSSGSFTALPMALLDGTYRTTNGIPPKPFETVVEYYIEGTFRGPGDVVYSELWPIGGPAAPASYQIPRNRPGSVWINEVDYVHWFGADAEYIELAGAAGSDLSDWRIELVDATSTNPEIRDQYFIPADTILADYDDIGFGFFVFARPGVPEPPRDMLLTNQLSTLMGASQLWGIRLINELGQIEHAISLNGYGAGFEPVEAIDSDFWPPETNTVALTGTGSDVGDFQWLEVGPPTPGAPNVGQTFGDPPVLVVTPGLLQFDYLVGSFSPAAQSLVVSNAGAFAMSYTMATNRTWMSVTDSGSQTLQPGESHTHLVSVNTSNQLGNTSGSITVNAGSAAGSPFTVPVSLFQTNLPQALLAYSFDEAGTGPALNAGLAGSTANLTLAGGMQRTLSGLGASGAPGDRAMIFDQPTNVLSSAEAIPGLMGVPRLTVTGWLRTTATGDDHRLAGNRSGNHGFDFMLTDDYSRLSFISSAGGSPSVIESDVADWSTDTWTFFAVTFDQTDTSGEGLKFYIGNLTNALDLVSAHDATGLEPVGAAADIFQVGGDGSSAFAGRLDDIRVYTNAFDAMQLEALRQITVVRSAGAGDNTPPDIIQQPVSTSTDEFGQALFVVEATGNPAPTYQWRKNGTNIPGAMNNSLFFSSAQPSDAGTYDVVVENAVGQLVSQSVTLNVNFPPSFTAQPDDVYIYAGDQLLITAETVGYPPPRYRFTRNGTTVQNSFSPNYFRGSASVFETGTFQIIATNIMGTVSSANFTVRVLDPNALQFNLDNALTPTPSGIELRWESGKDRVFDVYWTTNLNNGFIPIATNLPAAPPTNVFTDSVYGTERQGFYTIRLREIDDE